MNLNLSQNFRRRPAMLEIRTMGVASAIRTMAAGSAAETGRTDNLSNAATELPPENVQYL